MQHADKDLALGDAALRWSSHQAAAGFWRLQARHLPPEASCLRMCASTAEVLCVAQLAGEASASPLLIDVRQYLPQTLLTPPPEPGTPPPSKMRVTIRDAPLGGARARPRLCAMTAASSAS